MLWFWSLDPAVIERSVLIKTETAVRGDVSRAVHATLSGGTVGCDRWVLEGGPVPVSRNDLDHERGLQVVVDTAAPLLREIGYGRDLPVANGEMDLRVRGGIGREWPCLV